MWVVKQIATRSRGSDWRGYFLIACVIILALLLAGTSWSAWQSSVERAAAEARQDYTLEVLLETDQLRTAALQQIRGGRGYLLTGRSIFLTPHTEGKRNAATAYRRLSGLLADNAEQAPRINALKIDLAHLDTVIGSMIASADDGRQTDALRTMRSGSDRDAIEAIIRTLDDIQGTERAALATRTAIAQSRAIANERYQYMLAGIGLLLLWLSILATVYVRKALAREHAARRELEQFALTDPLTGLPNRRAFMKALTKSMARAELARDRKLSLAIFDIDHFKRVNDLFGHPAGDAVIKEVGARASRALRQRDLIGRIGGEEFAILLPRADLETARIACERLREAIAGAPIVHGDSIIPVTASIGIAEFCLGEDRDNLMICADAALYEAKTGGRNQVRLAA